METMYNNGGYYGVQQNMGGYYDPNAMYAGNYQAYVPQQIQIPQNVNALTNEEIQALESARPSNAINLNIDKMDVLRAMCTHKKNGRDVVQLVNDGSGDVWCPICNERWNPNAMDKDQIQDLVKALKDQMQNAKWSGDLGTNLTRELFTILPLLEKYPEVHQHAMNTFNRYCGQNAAMNAQDASVYNMYNSLFGPNYSAYAQPQMVYSMPQTMPVNYMQGVPMGNPYVNPMQSVPYGINQAAPNQQMNQQANMMMNGAQAQAQTNQPPVYQPSTMTNQPPVYQPSTMTNQPPVYQPSTVTADGSKITNNQDGSTTSEKKIDL